MDLEPSWKTKLAYFRIKELKDVLSQLGLAKQGKKQELVVRISAVFSDEHGPSAVSQSHGVGKKNSIGKEGAARIIEDIYRKMQGSGATDLSSKSHSSSDIHLVKPKDDVSDPRQLVMKVRCPCDSLMITDSMIKCEDSSCHVWQHIACVIIPGKPMDVVLPKTPSQFYCDICRIKRADPYWVTIGHPLLPLMLTSSGTAGDGSTTSRNTEQIFSLSRADRAMLNKDEYDLQAWCILLNDTVPFRMQWPLHAELLVNDMRIGDQCLDAWCSLYEFLCLGGQGLPCDGAGVMIATSYLGSEGMREMVMFVLESSSLIVKHSRVILTLPVAIKGRDGLLEKKEGWFVSHLEIELE